MHLPLLYALTIRIFFGLLFGAALAHKLANWPTFEAAVNQYLAVAGVPRGWVLRLVAAFIAGMEFCALVACGWPSNGTWAAGSIAGALLMYGAAMSINLVRGNPPLDCGCSWGETRTPVSYALVVRNCGLALLALPLAIPVDTRPIEPVEIASVVMAVVTAAVLYAALNGLSTGAKAAVREAK